MNCNWMYCNQKPRQEPQGLYMLSLYNPPTLYISKMTMTSPIDVTIVCFPLQVGKTLCMCSTVILTCLHIHWHPCLAISNSHTWTISSILYPDFQACDTYMSQLLKEEYERNQMVCVLWGMESRSGMLVVVQVCQHDCTAHVQRFFLSKV